VLNVYVVEKLWDLEAERRRNCLPRTPQATSLHARSGWRPHAAVRRASWPTSLLGGLLRPKRIRRPAGVPFQTTAVDTISLLRLQVQHAHELLEATMSDVTADQAHWPPPGRANPLGASYAHVVVAEDAVINGMLRGQAPLLATAWAGRSGISESPPGIGGDNLPPWDQWARRARFDLAALRRYAAAVHTSADDYLASLAPADLDRQLDLSSVGMGSQTIGWVLSNVVLAHTATHCGEIVCLKGLQGARAHPSSAPARRLPPIPRQ